MESILLNGNGLEMNIEDYRQEVVGKFDDYLQRTESRGISWGEIAHFDNLNKQQLTKVEREIDNAMKGLK